MAIEHVIIPIKFHPEKDADLIDWLKSLDKEVSRNAIVKDVLRAGIAAQSEGYQATATISHMGDAADLKAEIAAQHEQTLKLLQAILKSQAVTTQTHEWQNEALNWQNEAIEKLPKVIEQAVSKITVNVVNGSSGDVLPDTQKRIDEAEKAERKANLKKVNW